MARGAGEVPSTQPKGVAHGNCCKTLVMIWFGVDAPHHCLFHRLGAPLVCCIFVRTRPTTHKPSPRSQRPQGHRNSWCPPPAPPRSPQPWTVTHMMALAVTSVLGEYFGMMLSAPRRIVPTLRGGCGQECSEPGKAPTPAPHTNKKKYSTTGIEAQKMFALRLRRDVVARR